MARQSVTCPLCRSSKSGPVVWSARWPQLPQRWHGPLFECRPYLLVIHSGVTSAAVAEYLRDPPDGRVVSAHLAWSASVGGFVQGVALNVVAWHVGGSRAIIGGRVNRRLNFGSVGLELPGPWDMDRTAYAGVTREAVIHLMEAIPSLRYVAAHRDIDGRKRDPGPGWDWSTLDKLGLTRVVGPV